MKVNSLESADDWFAAGGNYRGGQRKSSTLLSGIAGTPQNYKLGYSQGVEGAEWTTPRHHHNFEQFRYVLEGDYSMAKNKVIPTGWVGYFPESVHYGPQVKSANLTMLTVQVGGPSGYGYVSAPERKAALAKLEALGGTFEGGIYKRIDENGVHRNQDAAEAVWEQAHNGDPIVYPPARYDSQVLMNPAAFSWIKDEDQPGVERKPMGTFTERDVRVAMVRIEPGAQFTFGHEPSVELLFVERGALSYGDKTYGPITAFGAEVADRPETLTAVEPTECIYFKLHTF